MGECHGHAGITLQDIEDLRAQHPGAEFLVHPECGCTTSVMEYLAEGDISAAHCHMLSTGGMLRYARESSAQELIVATETGLLHPLREQNPDKRFIPVSRMAVCKDMKMITLPKLRDVLVAMSPQVHVPPDIAARARLPIERMVAIT